MKIIKIELGDKFRVHVTLASFGCMLFNFLQHPDALIYGARYIHLVQENYEHGANGLVGKLLYIRSYSNL